jgi:hypothetical protein
MPVAVVSNLHSSDNDAKKLRIASAENRGRRIYSETSFCGAYQTKKPAVNRWLFEIFYSRNWR